MGSEEVTQSSQSQEAQSSGGDENQTQNNEGTYSAEDFQRKLSDLAAENKKYRQTFGSVKQENEELRQSLEELRTSQLKEQGKYKDLYEKAQKEAAEERQRRLKDRAEWTGNLVASRFMQEAQKLGCQDPMALVKIANADGLLQAEGLVSDDSFDINDEALKSVVEEAKQQNAILFARATPSVKDGVPKPNGKVSKQDLSKMSMDDLMKMADSVG